MSITTLVGFITLKDASGDFQGRYQNAKRDSYGPLSDEEGNYDRHKDNFLLFDEDNNGTSSKYYFLPFIYQGAAKNRAGDNLEAALVFANNQISMNRVQEAVKNRWTVQVDICKVNPTTLVFERKLTTEVWLAASLSYDPTTVEILLSSGIDAVGSNAPNRVLTTEIAGHLPITGQIRNK